MELLKSELNAVQSSIQSFDTIAFLNKGMVRYCRSGAGRLFSLRSLSALTLAGMAALSDSFWLIVNSRRLNASSSGAMT